MPVVPSVRIRGDGEVRRVLTALGRRELPVEALESLGGALVGRVRQDLQKGGANRIRTLSGDLARSVRTERGPGNNRVRTGTPLVYGAVHEFGRKTGRGRLRAGVRPWLAPSARELARRDGERILVTHLRRELARAQRRRV